MVYSYARAFSLADTSAVMLFDFICLPMAVGAAFLLLTEVGDVWTWAGSALIFLSSIMLVRAESAKKRV